MVDGSLFVGSVRERWESEKLRCVWMEEDAWLPRGNLGDALEMPLMVTGDSSHAISLWPWVDCGRRWSDLVPIYPKIFFSPK